MKEKEDKLKKDKEKKEKRRLYFWQLKRLSEDFFQNRNFNALNFSHKESNEGKKFCVEYDLTMTMATKQKKLLVYIYTSSITPFLILCYFPEHMIDKIQTQNTIKTHLLQTSDKEVA